MVGRSTRPPVSPTPPIHLAITHPDLKIPPPKLPHTLPSPIPNEPQIPTPAPQPGIRARNPSRISPTRSDLPNPTRRQHRLISRNGRRPRNDTQLTDKIQHQPPQRNLPGIPAATRGTALQRQSRRAEHDRGEPVLVRELSDVGQGPVGDVSDRLAAAVVDVEAGETDEGALLQLGLAHADVDGGDAVGGSGVWREEEAEG